MQFKDPIPEIDETNQQKSKMYKNIGLKFIIKEIKLYYKLNESRSIIIHIYTRLCSLSSL